MANRDEVAEQPVQGPAATLLNVAKGLERFGQGLSVLAEALAIVCLCALVLLVIAQTIMGTLASYFPLAASAMSVSWEYAGYLMGAAFMFGMAQTLRLGGHIRVNLIFDQLKGNKQRLLDLVATLASVAMMVLLAQSLTSMAVRSLTTNSLSTASLTPLWIPEGAFALASWLFTLQLVIRAVALVAGLPAEQPRDYVGAEVE